MAGAYCQFCGQRCFVYREVIAAGAPVWTGHMATCESGKEHDRKVLGMDSDTAHNPFRHPVCACPNVCGPKATVEATDHDASMNEPIGVVGGDAIRCVHGSSECCADYGDTATGSPPSFQDKLDRDHAALGGHEASIDEPYSLRRSGILPFSGEPVWANMIGISELGERTEQVIRLQSELTTVRAALAAIHQRHKGRCTECVERCDCPDENVCTHGNVPWPCRTAVAGGFAELAPTPNAGSLPRQQCGWSGALDEHTECQGADFSRIAAVLGEGVEEHIRRDGLSPLKAALFRSRGGHAPGEVCPSDPNPAPIHAPDCELLYDGDECTCDAWRRQAKPDAAPNPGEVDRG